MLLANFKKKPSLFEGFFYFYILINKKFIMKTFIFIIILFGVITILNFLYRNYLIKKRVDFDVINKKTSALASVGLFIILSGIIYINFIYVKKEIIPVKVKHELTDKEVEELVKKYSEPTKESTENLLSGWDGSLPALVDYVKERLHNPDSFEHVETGFINKTDYIQMKMIYRAENGFGAIRKSAIVAKIDFYGNIIEIISQ